MKQIINFKKRMCYLPIYADLSIPSHLFSLNCLKEWNKNNNVQKHNVKI